MLLLCVPSQQKILTKIKEVNTSLVFSINRRIIKTQCFPLYTLIQAVGIGTVDLLVLDVEGAEFEVNHVPNVASV